MSIYKPNLWLNQWYRGEKCPFFTYLKNLNSHKMLKKIKGGQNQHLGAPKQALLHHESALFSFKTQFYEVL